MLQSVTRKFWSRITTLGIFLFIILYLVATFFYPGGSQEDKTIKGFSWLNNYWCDLLSEKAKNGYDNTARPIAIISWIVLCFSLSVFWYFLPMLFSINEKSKNVIRFFGLAATAIAVFLFTSLHDIVIQSAGLLAFIAFIAVFAGLYKTRLYWFFYTGIFCFLLMGLNYGIMVGNTFISYLPLIQKITFIIVLAWILLVNREIYLSSSDDAR